MPVAGPPAPYMVLACLPLHFEGLAPLPPTTAPFAPAWTTPPPPGDPPPSTPASCPALLPPAGIEPLPAHIRPPPDQMLRGQRRRVVWSLPRLRRSEGRGGQRRRASSPAHPSWLALPSAPPCPSSQAPSHVYSGHSSHVTNVDFLCDDSHLISTGGKDTSIMQWRVI